MKNTFVPLLGAAQFLEPSLAVRSLVDGWPASGTATPSLAPAGTGLTTGDNWLPRNCPCLQKHQGRKPAGSL